MISVVQSLVYIVLYLAALGADVHADAEDAACVDHRLSGIPQDRVEDVSAHEERAEGEDDP